MKKLYLVLTLLLFSFIVNAAISGPSNALCPNTSGYWYQTQYSDSNFIYEWSVTGGTIEHGINTSSVMILWHDTNGTHKVSVTVRNGDANLGAQYKTVKVFSLKNLMPADFTNDDFNVSPGNNALITYKIPAIYFPQYSGDKVYIYEYQWVIPNGWKYGSYISNGTTPITTSAPNITVEPDNCTGGKIKVRGVSGCSSTSPSDYREKTIYRNGNPISKSSSTTVCEKPMEITLSVNSIPGASYQWIKPSSWSWTSSTNTNIVKVMPDGQSGGTIYVTVDGCTASKEPANITLINWDPNETEPSTSGDAQICTSYKNISLINAYSNTTNISWVASPSSLFYTSSGNLGTGTTASLKAKSSSVRGRGTITFTIRNQCGGTYTVQEHDVWVGSPNFTLIGDPNDLFPRQRSTVTVDYAEDGFFLQGVNNVVWSSTGAVASLSGNLFKADFVTATSGEYGAIYALATNACGSKENRYDFEMDGGFTHPRGMLKSGELSIAELNLEPTIEIDKVAIFPNPVKDIINIQVPNELVIDTKCSIEIYSVAGKLQIKHEATSNTSNINLNNLPTGIYIIKIISNGEIITKKINKQ